MDGGNQSLTIFRLSPDSVGIKYSPWFWNSLTGLKDQKTLRFLYPVNMNHNRQIAH